MPGPWVYMLECSDGSFYVGIAQTDLDRRIGEHQNGTYPGYTALRRPVKLVWAAEYERFDQAIAFERQLKGWSRAKKIALIEGTSIGFGSRRRGVGGRPGEGHRSFVVRGSAVPSASP